MSRALFQLLFGLWCLASPVVAWMLFVIDGSEDHLVCLAAISAGVGYLLFGAALFKLAKFGTKHFLPRIEVMKREGFTPDCELVVPWSYAGFSRPQGRAVFLKSNEKQPYEFAISELVGATRVQRHVDSFIDIRTHRLEQPLISLMVPPREADLWLAKIQIVLNQPNA